MKYDKYNEYKILEEWRLEELEKLVCSYINNGWNLVGGVSFNEKDNCSKKYVQAIIRTREINSSYHSQDPYS